MMFNVFFIVLLFPFVLLAQNKNYLPNPDFELGNTGYVSLGTQTLDRTESGNLDQTGKQSIKLVGGSGDYIESRPTKIDETLSGKNCSVSIKYKLNSGAGYLTVFSGATVGSMTEISTDFRGVFESLSSAQNIRIASFPCPSSGFVKLRVQFTSASSSVNLDNAYLGLAEFGEVSNVTSWKSYTPIITASSGSLTNFSLTGTEYMRVGSSIFIKGTLTFTGAVGTWNRPRISLPAGMVIDNTAPATMSGVLLNDNGSNRYGSDVTLTQGTSFVQIESYRGSNGVIIDPTQAAPFGWTSGDSISWTIGPIKIVGLDSSSTVINAECPSAGQCEDLFTADVNTSGTITNQTPVNWLTSCTSFAPSVCTFVTNHFSVTPKCWAATTASASASFGFDTAYSGTTTVTMDRKDEMGVRRSINYTLFCRRATTDFKGKRVLQAEISNNYFPTSEYTICNNCYKNGPLYRKCLSSASVSTGTVLATGVSAIVHAYGTFGASSDQRLFPQLVSGSDYYLARNVSGSLQTHSSSAITNAEICVEYAK